MKREREKRREERRCCGQGKSVEEAGNAKQKDVIHLGQGNLICVIHIIANTSLHRAF